MFQIKLVGLPPIDQTSLKSMLGLAKNLLTHDWQITEKANVDLTIYSFDTDEGKQAWLNRKEGNTALLSKSGNITEPVDIVIKKPLRTSNFSDALNLIAEKLTSANGEISPQKANKSSVLNNLSKGINKYLSKASSKRASVIHELPELSAQLEDTLIDIVALEQWLKGLAKTHNTETVANILGNLIPLNRVELTDIKRIDLQEKYRKSIFDLLANRELSTECRSDDDLKQETDLIKSSLLMLDELNHGYKRIIHDCYLNKEKPETNPLMLFCLVKVAEVTAMQLLFCYQHYRAVPALYFKQLHQLFLYCESMQVLEALPEHKTYKANGNFSSHYKQALLIAIADPYNLERFDVLRLFNLLKKLAAHAEIKTISQKQIEATSDFLMTGHFCIDADSDDIPRAMNKTAVETRQKDTSRLLNVQPVLLNLEKIFKQTAATGFGGGFDRDIQLLKKVTPQLNTTYERRYQRVLSQDSKSVKLVQGIKHIHDAVRQNQFDNSSDWHLKNHGNGGLMLCRDSNNRSGLYIGDVVAIFEDDQPMKLATVRWLNLDNNNVVTIGVQLILGEPIAVICTPENETNVYPSLLIPEDDHNQRKILLTDKGLYTPKRAIRVSGDNEPYIASLVTLLDSSYYYEKFDFKVSPAS